MTRTTGPAQAHRVTLAGVMRSEWVKLWTLRGNVLRLAVAVIGQVGISLLVAAAVNSHWNRMPAAEHAHFDPITTSLAGVNLAVLFIGVMGVLVVTREWATGMIRATLWAVPTRLPIVGAKVAVLATVTFVLMVPAALASFVAGQRLLGTHGTTLSAPHAWRAVVGAALYLAVVAVLGIGIGFIVRNTAGGVATLMGLLLVVPGLVHVLPSDGRRHIGPYLPSNAGAGLFTLHPDPGALAPWTGFAVMCGWAVGVVVVGAVLLKRRDA